MSPSKKTKNNKELTDALLDDQNVLSPKFLHQFSDIQKDTLSAIEEIWDKVNPVRKKLILEDLESLQEKDTLLCFDEFAKFALTDDDPTIRSLAIHLLWESEDVHLVPHLLALLDNDPITIVRAAAAEGLGKYILLAETEKVPAAKLSEIVNRLVHNYLQNKEESIQLRSIESLGFSSQDEVIPLIENAFNHSEIKWIDSALLAMGRSANRRWEPQITEMLDHPNIQVRSRAAWAAGELEMTSVRDTLINFALDENEDEEVRLAAIWSLSQIGGEEARDALEELADSCEEDEMLDILEDALDNLAFTDDMHNFNIIS